MPIRPQHRWLYPIDWQQITDYIRFERAGGRDSFGSVVMSDRLDIFAETERG